MVIVVAALLLVAAAAPEPAAPRVAAESQASAVVRILPGAPIRFAEIEQSAPERFRDTKIHAADGSLQRARLVEFQ